MTDQTANANVDATAPAAEAPAEARPTCCLGDKCADTKKGRDPLWLVLIEGQPPMPIHDVCMEPFSKAAIAGGYTVGAGMQVEFKKTESLKEIQLEIRRRNEKSRQEKLARKAESGAKSLLDGFLGQALKAAAGEQGEATTPAE